MVEKNPSQNKVLPPPNDQNK